MKRYLGDTLVIFISLLLILGVYSFAFGKKAKSTMAGLVYVNDLRDLTEEDFAKIRDGKEVEYILSQVILHPDIFSGRNELERDRIIELAEAGKKVVIQFWFGPGGWYNWSYCSYPNIAMQKEVRDYLFQVIDRAIDQIGPEHIYGAHLLEEDCYFAVDIDEPGDWWQNKGAVRSGYEDGNAYTNFSNLRSLYNIRTPWDPKVPNVGQYAPEFMAETGLDMHNIHGDPLANAVLKQWMKHRLWAGAHKEFFKHLEEKYPTIRKFVWGSGGYYCGSTMDGLRDVVDGVITDLYGWSYGTYLGYSHMQTLLPDAEHLTILWGTADEANKRHRFATAYLNGISAAGFFEDLGYGAASFIDPARWAVNKRIFQDISRLPVIRPQHEILIITANVDNGFSTSPIMLPIFKLPANVYYGDAAELDLSEYEMIVLHSCTSYRNDLALSRYNMTAYGPDDQQLEDWVGSGGILVMTAPNIPPDHQCFLTENGIVWTGPETDIGGPATFYSLSDVARKYNLKPNYTLLTSVRQLHWGENVHYDPLPIGGVMKYGRGRIVIIPAFLPLETFLALPLEERYEWQREIAYYIADVVRGTAMLHDRSGRLAKEIVSPGVPFGLAWEDKANGVTVRIVFDRFNQIPSSDITIGKGKNKSPANADKAPPLAMECSESSDSMDSQETPYVIWGSVYVDGVRMTRKNDCAVILKLSNEVRSSCRLGTMDSYDNSYILGVPATADSSIQAELYIQIGDNVMKAATVPPGRPGQVTRLDLSVKTKPEASMLLQNYPNSFNPDTWIPYQLALDVDVTITIHDATGHLVRTLNLGRKPAGFYTSKEKAAYWDGRNEAGEPVSSGIYFYTIQAGEFAATRKMMVAR